MRPSVAKIIKLASISLGVAVVLFLARQNKTYTVGQCLQWTGPTSPERRNITVYLLEPSEGATMVGRVCYNDQYHRRHCETRVIEREYLDYLRGCDVFRPYQ